MAYEELAQIARNIALEAGAMILKLRENGARVKDTKSSSVDIVTDADTKSEAFIVCELKRLRPKDAIFGEEGTNHPGSSEISWVIDPIDGTVNYLYNLPAYCVSIAACVADENAYDDGRRAVAAAVFNPRTNELFWAFKGGGSWLHENRLQVPEASALNVSLVATGFGYTASRRAEQMQLLMRVMPHVRDIRRIGSAAYDLCLVAAGRLDGYFEKGIQPWDWAAGALIASEAGAKVLGAPGMLPGENLIITGAAPTAKLLQGLLSSS